MRILFLDDMDARHDRFAQRNTGATVHHVYTAKDAIKLLNKYQFDLVSLDHDLNDVHYIEEVSGAQENTGYDVAVHISNMPKDRLPKHIVIHSWNPVGAERMKIQMRGIGVPVIRKPF